MIRSLFSVTTAAAYFITGAMGLSALSSCASQTEQQVSATPASTEPVNGHADSAAVESSNPKPSNRINMPDTTKPADLDSSNTDPVTESAVAPIEFEQETLANGLRVIYAPLDNAPVVDVRVLYHVGSKDERPDRQGFAHMFEHMMFRGSAHVAPEEHMKLVNSVGGNSNAFTSFDQTVYYETLPASHLAMALWLEADRMASFKVSPEIYNTERNVVAEEWRMRLNRPYGALFDILDKAIFTRSNYRWTPIGDMDHLREAAPSELQEFFNRFYVPNNATLVISGNFEPARTKELVRQYFGWIPEGKPIVRTSPTEPQQTQAKQVTVEESVPLPAVVVAFKLPPYRSTDHEAIALLSDILDSGASGRLDRALVHSEHPLAMEAFATNLSLEDGGFLGIGAITLAGQTPEALDQGIQAILTQLRTDGVTQQELDKVKRRAWVSAINNRLKASQIGSELGTAALLTGDPGRVNTKIGRIDAVTVDDIKRVIDTYFRPDQATTVIIKPKAPGTVESDAATKSPSADETEPTNAATQPKMDHAEPEQQPIHARVVDFPADYPTTPPEAKMSVGRPFEKGTQTDDKGVEVVVLPDHRLPLVNWSLTFRRGSYNDEPISKAGLADLTINLMGRGAAGISYDDWSKDLDSRGIRLSISDDGDVTSVYASGTSDQVDYAIKRANQMLTQPNLDAQEFARLKAQTLSGLEVDLQSPTTVARNDLKAAIYGRDNVLGVYATPQSIESVTLEDVKDYYASTFAGDRAIVLFSGDITVDHARKLADELLVGVKAESQEKPADYAFKYDGKQKIIVVDNPNGKQATVRMAVPAYSLHSDDKFAGSLASQILSAGIESRMNRYVRAEKGLAYSSYGIFRPTRQGGVFEVGLDTKVQSAGDAILAAFKVLDTLRDEPVTQDELVDARQRVAGALLMQLQTIFQQASYRLEGMLNGYPIDYYDRLPQRLEGISAADIQAVMRKYVNPKQMSIIVVAPARDVVEQLKKIGTVEVVAMPAQRAQ